MSVSYRYKIKEIEKIFPYDENSCFILNNFHVWHKQLIIFIMLYITSLVFTYKWKFVPFDCFIQFPFASRNHKSDLFLNEFVCFWSMIDPQHWNIRKKIREIIPLRITSKRRKYLGINLRRYMTCTQKTIRHGWKKL